MQLRSHVLPAPFCWRPGISLCVHCSQGLVRLKELVRRLVDVVDGRVNANLEAIQDTLLVELPADR